MGRVPKYRAWYKPLGVMIHPENLVMINFDTKVLGVYMEMDGKGYHVLRMSDFELLEDTGLKDVNDKEIIEGDILLCDSSGINHKDIRVVCYDLYQTRYKAVPLVAYHQNAGTGGWTGYELKYHNEVIGNIYENPELLEV